MFFFRPNLLPGYIASSLGKRFGGFVVSLFLLALLGKMLRKNLEDTFFFLSLLMLLGNNVCNGNVSFPSERAFSGLIGKREQEQGKCCWHSTSSSNCR